MKDLLNVALFQFNPYWEDAEANIQKLNEWMANVPSETDMVILPEMFLTGFSMHVDKVAQTMDGIGVNWLKAVAQSKQLTVMGSLAINDDGQVFNRFLIATPDGEIQSYDKRHLFRMGKEHQYYSSGEAQHIFNNNGWKVMPLVCYDLRFPVWSRNVNLKYDLLIYVANWPESRREAFMTLLKVRAIENQCYVLAVNRVGQDPSGINYAGESVIIDPKGKLMNEPNGTEQIITGSISLGKLKSFREKFPAYLDADEFTLNFTSL
jgi:Predicted amidohydrolase